MLLPKETQACGAHHDVVVVVVVVVEIVRMMTGEA